MENQQGISAEAQANLAEFEAKAQPSIDKMTALFHRLQASVAAGELGPQELDRRLSKVGQAQAQLNRQLPLTPVGEWPRLFAQLRFGELS